MIINELGDYAKAIVWMLSKLGVLKNSAVFTGKHLRWSLFVKRLINFIKRCFPVNIAILLLKTGFFIDHLWWLLLGTTMNQRYSKSGLSRLR